MTPTFWTALAASSLAALVTTLGIFAVRRFETWARAKIVYFISYAAGVLIAASFLHLVPESFEMNPHAAALLLAGFAGMHFLHRFLCAFVCERHHLIQPGIGIVPVLGIGFHSFIDGIVYAVTYQVSLFTGTLAAVGMVLHEFPEGIVTYLLLIHGGFRPRAALWTALAAAAFTTPLGMLAAYPFISRIDAPLLGALLSLSAGMLVYVGATHLLPEAEHQRKPWAWLAFGAGVVTAIGIVLSE
ncbi:MAG: ZIP family metal transporter [Thiobacillus sp.]